MNLRGPVPLALACALALAGCYTGIRAPGITGDERAPPDGLRYYLPSPHLVVTELPGGKWDASVEYMVDRAQEFAVQPTVVLTQASATIEFNADGTLRSFQLNQKSAEIAETFVNGLKDVALKKLELDNEALKREIEEAEEAKEAREEADASGARGTFDAPAARERRKIFIYKIQGATPIRWEPEKPLVGTELPPPQSFAPRLRLTPAGDDIVLSVRTLTLGISDRDRLVFRKGDGKTVGEAVQTALRSKARVADGKIVISLNDLTSNQVVKIELIPYGDVDVPGE